MILSNLPGEPVNRTTATTVRPPLDATLKFSGPPSRYCVCVRLKLTCPCPIGPPCALYAGRTDDPTAAASRVDGDATLGGLPGMRVRKFRDIVLITTLTYLPDSQLVHTVEEEEDEYLPSLQAAQVEAPRALENLPASQLVQFAAPANEYVPAPQLVQEAELVCDVKPENLPASQLVQMVDVGFGTSVRHHALPWLLAHQYCPESVQQKPLGFM